MIKPAAGTDLLTTEAPTPQNDPFARLRRSGALGAEWTGANPAAWDSRFADLDALKQLEDDWDGRGADAPSPAVIAGAVRLARSLRGLGAPAAGRVISSVDGEVIFEWHAPGQYCEIGVVTEDRADVRVIPADARPPFEFTLERWA